MKFAEIAPELVVKLLLVCSVPHTPIKIMNGDKECKTVAEIKEVPEVYHMQELIDSQNWQQVLVEWEEYFFQGIEISQEDKETLVKLAIQQRNYLEGCEAVANNDIDINKIKVEVTFMIFRGW